METLIRKRGALKSKLTSFTKIFNEIKESIKQQSPDASDTAAQIIELQARLDRVESQVLKEFEDVQGRIEELTDNFDEQLEERESFERTFYKVVSTVKHFISLHHKDTREVQSITDHKNESISVPQHNIKLPEIYLPKFKGVFEDWLEFRDTFQSLIHENDSIGNIQKFHYLRASLQDGAAQVIHSIQFSADNYNLAWDMLCERYNNKSRLLITHVKALKNIPNITKESSTDIRNLVDQISKNLRCINILGQPTDQWDILLIFMMSDKLDNKTARLWEERKANGSIPTLDQFKDFLKSRADIMESWEINKNDQTIAHKLQPMRSRAFLATNNKCPLCKEAHQIYNCNSFLKSSVEVRYNNAKKLKLCLNCLREGHMSKDCKSGKCRKCNAQHNTLLHFEDSPTNNPKVGTSKEVSLTSRTEAKCQTQTLLSTALVQVFNADGCPRTCRALLDCGSQSNFISEQLCQQLGLEKVKIKSTIVGINRIESNITNKCEVKMQSLHTAFETKLTCLVLDTLTDELPHKYFDATPFQLPPYIRLADPKYNIPARIDIIIGAGIFWNLLCIGQHLLGPNQPMLQKTRLGWIMTGGVSSEESKVQVRFASLKNDNLHQQLEKFWAIEDNEPQRKVFSESEQTCEDLFVNTTRRDKTGRFIVTIPLKESYTKLGESMHGALKRFQSLERKFMSKPELRQNYIQFMTEYEQMGHMTKIAEEKEVNNFNYLPHHGVINESSLTTKLRVVFDGSATTETGVSFNDLQLVGPTIQDELYNILLRFRQHTYVVCADISKMYRQILVEPHQRKLQSILWRKTPSDEINTYTLNTVTYGTSSAPYLAIRCLSQLGIEHQNTLPAASKVIKSDFYVDDLLTGGENINDLAKTVKDVYSILQSAGFSLCKWISNNQHVLERLDVNTATECIPFGKNENAKTLGVYWSSNRDDLMYKISHSTYTRSISKRVILSEISQIFDPLGLLSPCIIIAKVILQQLWLCKLTWDESVPQTIHTKWQAFRKQLPLLNALKIPRHVMYQNATTIELHGFADASQEAYGACVYVRSKNEHGNVRVRLLTAKTRVAPIKALTIPRLELCGALILSQLIQKIKVSLTVTPNSIYLYSDSTVTLHWLNTASNLLQPFVSNRVSQIQAHTEQHQWHHIATGDNPADHLTRGLTPSNLMTNQLWWHGPSWLQKEKEEWPMSILEFADNPPELRTALKIVLAQEIESFPLERYSTLTRAMRVTAYCKRFKSNCKIPKPQRATGTITASELNDALKTLIKLSQRESFKTELNELETSREISSKSCLKKLSPFLDLTGTIRVGGRIQLSQCEYDQKHPIVLPKTSYLTKLLLIHEHERLSHAGQQHTLASIRDKYWPISGRKLIRQIIHSCQKCFRVKPRGINPIMGILPAERVTPAPPFYHTGVDYAGPCLIKNKVGRGSKLMKAYICLFVCMSVKAIHLELVTELTKEAFIAAFRRFTSRRGKPMSMFSDNGTNFVAASKELNQLATFLVDNDSQITTTLANDGITWNFIPARAPHFGGLWEAGIKSVKKHLIRTVGNTKLTFEQFYTVLTQIEAIVNSRPLLPLTSDPNDCHALTPSHFLIGKRLTSAPDPDVTHIQENRLSTYQYLQKLQQQFWSRWKKEYISELQVRVKWNRREGSIKEGSLVVIKDDVSPPLRWQLGRVIQLFPGPDGVARVANIKTQDGIIKRAFSKICPLPHEDT